jgi:hypothetical protein
VTNRVRLGGWGQWDVDGGDGAPHQWALLEPHPMPSTVLKPFCQMLWMDLLAMALTITLQIYFVAHKAAVLLLWAIICKWKKMHENVIIL